MMHISSVYNEIKPFKCEMCDKSFPKRTPLERHIRVAKIYGDKRTCPNHILEQSLENVLCLNIAPTKFKIEIFCPKYLEIHSSTPAYYICSWKKRPFKCEVCDFRCSEKGTLKKHVSSVHKKRKSFKCTLCGNSSSRNHHLKTHIESVHEKISLSNANHVAKVFVHSDL